MTPARSNKKKALAAALRRDIAFIAFGLVIFCIVAYVETNAADEGIRFGKTSTTMSEDEGPARICTDDGADEHQQSCTTGSASSPESSSIIDAGFIMTASMHAFLRMNPFWNDVLALLNSLCLALLFGYVAHVTVWKGDFALPFRLLATQLFRSLCGFLTYIPPPSSEFLCSKYDFPEVLLCAMLGECSTDNATATFVTFFSGHVASTVIIANHLYKAGRPGSATCLHAMNWLQAIRLLATRGHYSIDLIIGYVVAIFVSCPAGRLGLYYSMGLQPSLPSLVETFEVLVGVHAEASIRRGVHPNASPNQSCSETSVKLVYDIITAT